MARMAPETALQTTVQDSMELQVYGLSGWICSVSVAPDARISAVRRLLARAAGVPVRQQMLTSGGNQLDDHDVVGVVIGDAKELMLVRCDPSVVAKASMARAGRVVLARARAMVAQNTAQVAAAAAH
eukprot:TRINITY_DN33310_c0_g1_i1.p1 TRINITY_DN33310_c0_g1~~TRINITY_DN33310_c0_g1_i1.p1  ORF type:complete len:127 (+),score=31.24 TRINITY_DN33310_c0_g1_i1:67-447(+)